ncbi:MAG: DUF3224 domain-containing protein, partial [Rhodothermales bacterium]
LQKNNPMKIDIPFDITTWDPTPYDAPEAGPALFRVTVKKTYKGPLTGEGVAELLLCGQEGYLANERVSGELEGRSGTFVLQHGGVRQGEEAVMQFGLVIPGSGTGELANLRGDATFAHGKLSLDYRFD